MRRIEFLGPPGSGKSTIHAETVRNLQQAGTDAIDLDEAAHRAVRLEGQDWITRSVARMTKSSRSKTWKRAYARSTDRTSALDRFLGSNPILMEVIHDAQRNRIDRDLEPDLVLRWVLNLMTGYQLATDISDHIDALIMDEGYAQRAVAVFAAGFESSDTQALADYIDAIPTPNVLVVVETSLEECRDRLDRHGWSDRLVSIDPEARLRFLENALEITQIVIGGFEDTRTDVIWVSGTMPPTDSASAIAATLSPG